MFVLTDERERKGEMVEMVECLRSIRSLIRV